MTLLFIYNRVGCLRLSITMLANLGLSVVMVLSDTLFSSYPADDFDTERIWW
jgi:hypothetical protein